MGKATQFKMRKTIFCRSGSNFNYKAISDLYGHNRKTEFIKLASPWIHNLSSSFGLQDKTLRLLPQQTFQFLRKQRILWRQGRQREVRKRSSSCISPRSAKRYVGHKPALQVHREHRSSCFPRVLSNSELGTSKRIYRPPCLPASPLGKQELAF